MMRTTALFCLLGLAASSASHAGQTGGGADSTTIGRLAVAAPTFTDIQSRLSDHGNWEDISITCPAGASSLATCEFPQVSSTGIAGGDSTSSMRVVVVKFGGDSPITVYDGLVDAGTDAAIVASAEFSWDTPGYYMFSYTAQDAHSNDAEDVVFALFIDDLVAPVVTPLNVAATHYESCNPSCPSSACTHTAFPGFSAADNVNGDVSDTLTYSFKDGARRTTLNLDAAGASSAFNTAQTTCFAGGLALVVSATAHDSAGVFGQDGANNVGHGSTTFDISDTTPPTIIVNGNAQATVECCKRDYTDYNADRGDDHVFASCAKYQDAGATSNDAVDCNVPVQKVDDSLVNIALKGVYAVTYTAIDTCDNSATLTRDVEVVDTTPPFVALKGPASITIHQYNKNDATTAAGVETIDIVEGDLGTLNRWTNTALNDIKYVMTAAGVRVWDECTEIDAHTIAVTYHQGDTAYAQITDFAQNVGTYAIRYTVTDASGLTSTIDRTVIVVDSTKPIIRLTGGETTHYVELSDTSAAYVDPGATCKDYMDATITPTMSADTVDNTVIGTYIYTYSCVDASNNNAVDQTRKVIVRDTQAPKFVMNLGGGQMITDASKLNAHAGDLHYPTTPAPILICENNVEAGFPFKDPSGVATDLSGTTITISNNIAAESASRSWNQRSCAGIKRVHPSSQSGYYFITTDTSGATLGQTRVECNMESPTDTDTTDEDTITGGHHLTKGSYVYQYFVVDGEGNTNDCWNHHEGRAVPACRDPTTYVRLVTVTDNLPPVITLHNRAALNEVYYEAATHDNANPFTAGALMAETSSANGWFIGAIAAATAGIALLALGNKKSAATVPV
jgi:hypothetical protein